jgi:leucyl/phenylalanyl-tRNA--protein transferase
LTYFIKRLIPPGIRKRLRQGQRAAVDGFNRFLARSLSFQPGEDSTGLSYMFEVQPYSLELVLQGYLSGLFSTTFYKTGFARWHDPEERGVLPIQEFHVPSNLRKILRKETFEYRVDTDFRLVMENCAEGRGITHITSEYMDVYFRLYEMGFAHSVSVWKDGEMVAGRFGIAIGAYFSGESRFQRIPNAGKAVLVRFAEILAAGGFLLHDTGWRSEFMEQFGGRAVPRDEFHRLHSIAIATPTRFDANAPAVFSSKTSGA